MRIVPSKPKTEFLEKGKGHKEVLAEHPQMGGGRLSMIIGSIIVLMREKARAHKRGQKIQQCYQTDQDFPVGRKRLITTSAIGFVSHA